ncbi:MAG TPA: site-specific integrase [Ktedonobacteraceae bacterium]|nr:site-specific integrase [Ktedonobacteraceae bacterium]
MPRRISSDDTNKRQPKGVGSVFQRSDGSWIAQITLENGKQKQYRAKTEKDANVKLRKALDELERGSLLTEKDQTLREYLEHWLENVKRPSLKVGSYLRYRDLVDKQILPALGHYPLRKLKPEHLEAFYARLQVNGRSDGQRGLAAKTVRLVHGVLYQSLEAAVRRRRIPYNVCRDVTLPRVERQEMLTLSADEAQRLLATAKGHRLEALLTLALTTGMRRGELLALQWKDIDWKNGSLQVRRSVNRYAGQGFKVSEPKTKQSRRKITLPSFVLEVLKEHRTRQLEERLQVGSRWKDLGLVFSNAYGSYLNPSHLGTDFHKLLKKAKLPMVRFHDLRHTAASLLLKMNVSPKMVQEILGHSDIEMTLGIYSHVLPGMHEEAMEKMDQLFKNPDDQNPEDEEEREAK